MQLAQLFDPLAQNAFKKKEKPKVEPKEEKTEEDKNKDKIAKKDKELNEQNSSTTGNT